MGHGEQVFVEVRFIFLLITCVFFLFFLALRWFVAQPGGATLAVGLFEELIQLLKLSLTGKLLIDHNAHAILSLHLHKYSWVNLTLFDVLPDDTINDITCEITQSDLPLWA